MNPKEWAVDCLAERGRVLMGWFAHYCPDWAYLTMDETCSEFETTCTCKSALLAARGRDPMRTDNDDDLELILRWIRNRDMR